MVSSEGSRSRSRDSLSVDTKKARRDPGLELLWVKERGLAVWIDDDGIPGLDVRVTIG